MLTTYRPVIWKLSLSFTPCVYITNGESFTRFYLTHRWMWHSLLWLQSGRSSSSSSSSAPPQPPTAAHYKGQRPFCWWQTECLLWSWDLHRWWIVTTCYELLSACYNSEQISIEHGYATFCTIPWRFKKHNIVITVYYTFLSPWDHEAATDIIFSLLNCHCIFLYKVSENKSIPFHYLVIYHTHSGVWCLWQMCLTNECELLFVTKNYQKRHQKSTDFAPKIHAPCTMNTTAGMNVTVNTSEIKAHSRSVWSLTHMTTRL